MLINIMLFNNVYFKGLKFVFMEQHVACQKYGAEIRSGKTRYRSRSTYGACVSVGQAYAQVYLHMAWIMRSKLERIWTDMGRQQKSAFDLNRRFRPNA